MILLNFSHPLEDRELRRLGKLIGQPVAGVWDEMPHFDHELSFVEQVRALLDRAGLSAEEWQTAPLLVNPPGYAPAAAVLLAEIHGRRGHFPAILRLRPVEEGPITRFEVAEVINLQAVRDGGRLKRKQG